MAIEVFCDSCFTSFRVRDELLGKRIRCKECGEPVVVKPSEDFSGPAALPPRKTAGGSPKRRPQKSAGPGAGVVVGGAVAALLLFGLLAFGAVSLLTSDDAEQPETVAASDGPGFKPPLPGNRPASVPAGQPAGTPQTTPAGTAASGTSGTSTTANGAAAAAAARQAAARQAAPISPWTMKPDPAPELFTPAEGKAVRLAFPQGASGDKVVYPHNSAEFVALGSNFREADVREVWNLGTGEKVGTIHANMGADRGALSPDGRWFVGANSTKDKLLVMDVAGQKMASELTLSPGPTTTVLRFASPERLVTLRYQQPLEVWSIPEGKKERSIDVSKFFQINSLTTSPGGHYAALVMEGHSQLGCYNLDTGQNAGIVSLKELTSEVNFTCDALAFSPDGAWLAAVFKSYDKEFGHQLFGWDVTTGKVAFQHRIPAELKDQAVSGTNQSADVRWFRDSKLMLLFGRFVFDRESGGPLWRVPTDNKLDGEQAVPFDTNRILLAGGDYKKKTVAEVVLPLDEVVAAAATISAGGTADDADLPPLTKADDSASREVSLTSAAWRVTPGTPDAVPENLLKDPVPINTGAQEPGAILLSTAGSGRAVIAFDEHENRAVVRLVELTDLPGQRDIEIPFGATVLDLSPDGTRLLTRVSASQGRLDLWSLPEGEHLAGWRPHLGLDKGAGDLVAASFIDSEHVLSLSRDGLLTLWEVPACRSIYTVKDVRQNFRPNSYQETMARIQAEYEAKMAAIRGTRPGRNKEPEVQPVLNPGLPAISPDGKTMALWHDGALYFLDSLSGQVTGTVSCSGPLGASAFSPSGTQFAATLHTPGGASLVTVQLSDGTISRDIPLPQHGSWLHWCSDSTLLLDNTRLIDLEHGRIVWTYLSRNAVHSPDSPGGLHIACLPSGGSSQQLRLAAVALPDSEAAQKISGNVPPPELILGERKKLSLNMRLAENPPENPQFSQQLQQSMTEQLERNGIEVAASQSLSLTVTLARRSTGKQAEFRRLGNAGGGNISISEDVLDCAVSISQGGKKLWGKETHISNVDVGFARIKPGETAQQNLARNQWSRATQYLTGIDLPGHLFPEGAEKGLGSSSLKPGR